MARQVPESRRTAAGKKVFQVGADFANLLSQSRIARSRLIKIGKLDKDPAGAWFKALQELSMPRNPMQHRQTEHGRELLAARDKAASQPRSRAARKQADATVLVGGQHLALDRRRALVGFDAGHDNLRAIPTSGQSKPAKIRAHVQQGAPFRQPRLDKPPTIDARSPSRAHNRPFNDNVLIGAESGKELFVEHRD